MSPLRCALLLLAALALGCEAAPYCFNCGLDAVAPVEVRPPVDAVEVSVDVPEEFTEDAAPDRPPADAGGCEGVDLQRDPRHCGGCGRRCALARAFPMCEAGRCVVRACDAGFYDLDGDPTNGCEYACSPVPGATDDRTCDRRDDDCDGRADEDVDLCTDAGGGTCAAANTACRVARCEAGFLDLDRDAATGCEYACTPSGDEACDGRDNDCDGMVDEGDPGGGGPCGAAEGACRRGVLRCVSGALACEGGVAAAPETCNGVDDDCNGAVDDGDLAADARVGARCGSGTGDCRQGTSACAGGRVVCAGAVEARPEACDGRDNDCNGMIDDGIASPGPCGRAVGACRPGTLQCVGAALACVGATDPRAETCNGADDDCDGAVDDGFDLAGDPAHCGACGRACAATLHGVTACVAGACRLLACEAGYFDDPRTPTVDCDYACEYQGPAEVCNGRDDDCDGAVDEAITAPEGYCRVLGACAGALPRCDGGRGFVCGYGPAVELDPATGQPAAVETRCDGVDNNCNGAADESFAALDAGCTNGGVGACGAAGRIVCDGAGTGTTCSAPPVGMAGDEVCNGRDDDCDGAVDETALEPGMDPSYVRTPWVAVGTSGAATLWVMQYEASRPGATRTSPGAASNRACAMAGVIPWTNLTAAQAATACAAAGARLCTEAEWTAACQSTTRSCGWSYATACGAYQTTTCNGADYDADPGAPGVQNGALLTGALAACYADWSPAAAPLNRVFDLSGNVKEFTAPRAPGVHPLRGGAFSNIANGTSCTFDWTVVDDAFAFGNVGFRCCFAGATPP